MLFIPIVLYSLIAQILYFARKQRRFTTELASRAKHVTAIDFMENYISKNIEANGHLSNVSFMTADVTELELPNNR